MKRRSLVSRTFCLFAAFACAPVWGATPPKTVKVNRTLPKIKAAPLWPVFSENPTDTEIIRARVFGEPLIPLGGPAPVDENRDLGNALLAFLHRADSDDTSALTRFLDQHPRSVWRASLLTNLGMVSPTEAPIRR